MDYGVIVGLATAGLGAAATYGALATRLARAEQDVKGIASGLEKVGEKVERSSSAQGQRLGDVEETVSRLEGQCQVILRVIGEEPPGRVRRPTRPPPGG